MRRGKSLIGNAKRCSKCKVYKPLTEYTKNIKGAGGVGSYCRNCRQLKRKSPEDTFWKYYWSHVEQVDGCLIWTGRYSENGQSFCYYKGNNKVRVRRLVYRLAIGDLPDNMFVLSTCNNRRCVKHGHLKLGTEDESNAHRWNNAAKGDRHSSRTCPEKIARGDRNAMRLYPDLVKKGEQKPNVKLTEVLVRAIREEYAKGGTSQPKLAAKYGVDQALICRIVHRKTWKHVQ